MRNTPKSFNLKDVFSPSSPLQFIGLAAVTTLINLVSVGHPLGFIGILVIAILWWWIDRGRAKKLAEKVQFQPTKQPPAPAKGLILLLSPYSPQKPELKALARLQPLLDRISQTATQQLTTTDFEAIDLFNSNLVPQIKAVEYHVQEGRLKEIWLITTQTYQADGRTVKGSEITAAILEKYLNFRYGDRVEVHREGLSVVDWDYYALSQLVETIFRQSGYRDKELVADITGGTKMMSVALSFACIPPQRRMQYMDSKRDWQGQPLEAGEIKPIAIDIDSILYPES